MSKIGATLLVIAFLVALPITLPASILLHLRYKRRLRKLARSESCLNCGEILGLEALRLADAEWSAHVAELRKQKPGVLLRLVRRLHAICPNCGTRYKYSERQHAFTIMASGDPTILQ